MNILTLNAGSSSSKFALYREDPARRRLLRGQVDRIGSTDTAIDVDMSGAEGGETLVHTRHPVHERISEVLGLLGINWTRNATHCTPT
ncbi:MAG: hypothetical protein ABI434_23690 [Burkholderiaceae bacterium]